MNTATMFTFDANEVYLGTVQHHSDQGGEELHNTDPPNRMAIMFAKDYRNPDDRVLDTFAAQPAEKGPINPLRSTHHVYDRSTRVIHKFGSYTAMGGTLPIAINMTPCESRSRSRARGYDEGDIVMADPTPRPDHPGKRNGRKKKRAQKKGDFGVLNTVRGFTPATSGDEGSDFSTSSMLTRRDISMLRNGSTTFSSGVRSASPSALTQQIEAMYLENRSRSSSMLRSKSKLGSGTTSSGSVNSYNCSEIGSSEMISYEVPLEHDFISPDVAQRVVPGENTFLLDHVVRKMSASDFEPLRCLGKGTYGTVLLVRQISTGRLYAQKQFKKASLTVRKQLVEQTKTERVILESINRHPFVVKLYYAFQDHEKLYLILEYAQGGELFTRMLTERMLPEDKAAFYMAEMVLALEHLHHNVGVVYRDLKPENILLDADGHVLLTDFGLSKVAVDGKHRCRSMTGTLEYMAPEVILQESYGTAVDWWSFGILGFDLLTGASPFRANNEAKVTQKILKQKITFPFFLSPDARDLLTRLLRKDPRKRLGACMPKDMETIKKHRFFRKIDWKKLELREVEPPIKPLITNPELAENFLAEFTDLALSPVTSPRIQDHEWGFDSMDSDINPFGGFSFVASRSLLEGRNGFL
jgi:serine/threonine-protein kinase Psk1